ncbi:MAG: hypothetical protein PVI57_18535, partial [Gemmatimonadota bacterium]
MRLHRLLRGLLPARFRRVHGEDMERTFAQRLDRARREGGRPGAARAWVREARDLAWTGLRLRARASKGGDGMRGWRDDVGYALRSLGRSPLFTAFAGGALALGIGSATALYSAVDRIVLNPLDFPEADRIVSVWRRQGDLLAS